MFLLYVNDLPLSSKLLLFILFADNTAAILGGESIKCAGSVANNEQINIACWYKANLLVLNISIKNCIHFKLFCRDVDQQVIFSKNAILEYVLVVKNLGMYKD